MRQNNTKTDIRPLRGLRILVCGKGGCGKSTTVALATEVLSDKGYQVHVLDGDASNLGLYWMLGFERNPEPLMDFYGGKQFSGGKVTCPVDDPTPLSRGEISLDELPDKYYVEKKGIVFFRSGKIEKVFEGCDGPESKITRDFRVPGEHVTLIDMGAGLEHFGRGVGISANGVIVVIDPNSTSLLFAKAAKDMVGEIKKGANPAVAHLGQAGAVAEARKLAGSSKLEYLWVILNRIRSEKVESLMRARLTDYGVELIGSIREDPEILESSLERSSFKESGARKDMEEIVGWIEKEIASKK
jgi:CO dehydrogenase maturation factor